MKTKCTYSGCKRPAVYRSRCAKHQEKRKRKEYDHHKVGMAKSLYCTSRWRRLREIKFSQSPVCEMCSKLGKLQATEAIDHWIEVSMIKGLGNDALIWDLENLVAMCWKCHNQKTKLVAQMLKSDMEGLKIFLSEYKPSPMSENHRAALYSIK